MGLIKTRGGPTSGRLGIDAPTVFSGTSTPLSPHTILCWLHSKTASPHDSQMATTAPGHILPGSFLGRKVRQYNQRQGWGVGGGV